MREVINGLLRKAGAALEDGKQVLELEEPLGSEHDSQDTKARKTPLDLDAAKIVWLRQSRSEAGSSCPASPC